MYVMWTLPVPLPCPDHAIPPPVSASGGGVRRPPHAPHMPRFDDVDSFPMQSPHPYNSPRPSPRPDTFSLHHYTL
ncbi:hypothetical protein Pcinc_043554 [Petrolisthes cinctipes]|uniref:Uncharacterized protein n=1 Tax=Petrolisthes cinctipes TaxID=88211 RepID=A0AAE1BFQ1_PETCI|nr:hypothetical protein Pcinc_043554 [Petrolisthes cinctipes]